MTGERDKLEQYDGELRAGFQTLTASGIGRLACMTILVAAGWRKQPYRSDGDTEFRCGQLNVALYLEDQLREASPENFRLMEDEYAARTAYLVEPDPAEPGGDGGIDTEFDGIE